MLGRPAFAAVLSGAEDVVRATTDEVVTRLRAERAALSADPARLRQLVEELILPHVDFVTMAEFVLAPRWSELSAGERACFRSGLRQHLVTRYAGLLRLYDEQAVSYATTPGSDGRGTVVQTIALAEGPPLVIGYRMQAAGEVWRVVDFTVDGESLVEGYRDQYRYEIGRVGIGDFLRSFDTCRER